MKNKEIYILGVDQGYANLGLAILKHNLETKATEIVETKTIVTKPCDTMELRLKIIYNSIKEVLKNYKVKYAGCERLFHNNTMKNGRNKSANIVYTNMATGVVYLLCAQRNIAIKDFAPTTVKKALTGNGRATKEEVEEALEELVKKYGIEPQTNHESDAIGIGITTIRKLQEGEE